MSINLFLALFNDVEYEIQSFAWPTDDGKPHSVNTAVELLRVLRSRVISHIQSDESQGPGTPDDVIAIAQSQFRELNERKELSDDVTQSLCEQLVAMRFQIKSTPSPLIVTEPEDAACYNE